MSDNPDPTFALRCDAYIDLANAQAAKVTGPNVAASMSYATARYNAWLCANMYGTAEEMTRMRAEAITLLSDHYRKMLEENFDDCIKDFGKYVRIGTETR